MRFQIRQKTIRRRLPSSTAFCFFVVSGMPYLGLTLCPLLLLIVCHGRGIVIHLDLLLSSLPPSCARKLRGLRIWTFVFSDAIVVNCPGILKIPLGLVFQLLWVALTLIKNRKLQMFVTDRPIYQAIILRKHFSAAVRTLVRIDQ